ncbi:MAG TPA: hypothetical protein VG167_21905 [Verrucomicrobiae bacterium]|nr:hypothetical protein [Verrucomicrobiae bacterium]
MNKRVFQNVLFTAVVLCLMLSTCLESSGQSRIKKRKNNPKKTHVLYVPLIPKATESGYSGDLPVGVQAIYFEVIDERQERDEIGQNIEDSDKPAIKVVADDGDGPIDFIRKMMITQFQAIGIRVADKPEAAQRVVTLKLTRFWAEEAPSYHGTVAAAVEVKDGSRSLWLGASAGESKRFGRSLSTDNYRETLSDATVHMINKILEQQGFRGAIGKRSEAVSHFHIYTVAE